MAAAAGGSNFKPTVNKRPAYLGEKSPSQTKLVNGAPPRADDVFEQPLPGNKNKGLSIYEDSLEREHSTSSNNVFEQPLGGGRNSNSNNIFEQPLGGSIKYNIDNTFEQPLPGKNNHQQPNSNGYENYSEEVPPPARVRQLSGNKSNISHHHQSQSQPLSNYVDSNPQYNQQGCGDEIEDSNPNTSMYRSKYTKQRMASHGGSEGGYEEVAPHQSNQPQQSMGYGAPEARLGSGSGRDGRRKKPQRNGWNDDFISADSLGGVSDGPPAGARISERPPFQNNVERDDFLENMDQNYSERQKNSNNRSSGLRQLAPSAHDIHDTDLSQPAPRGGRRAAKSVKKENSNWNNDTTVEYEDYSGSGANASRAHPSPPPRSSPRMALSSTQNHNPPGVSVSSSTDVEKARSGLSLLKSRIRGGSTSSKSSGNVYGKDNGIPGKRVGGLEMSSGSMRIASKPNKPPGERISSAPTEYYASSNSNQSNEIRNTASAVHSPRGYEQNDYVPSAVLVPSRAKRTGVVSQSKQASHRHYNNYEDDEMDTPPKPSKSTNTTRKPTRQTQQPHLQSQSMQDPSQSRSDYQRQEEEAAASRYDAESLPPSAFADPSEAPQNECPDCGRKFNDKAYPRHVKICKKVFVEKRKAFDMTTQRVADNPEQLKLLKKTQEEERRKARLEAIAKGKKLKKMGGVAVDEVAVGSTAAEKKAKWKADHEQFQNALKAAKAYSDAKEKGEPLPLPVMSAPDPSLIPCPHCGRRFNEKAAERHIPQCNNIKAKPSTLKRGTGTGLGSKNANSKMPAKGGKRR